MEQSSLIGLYISLGLRGDQPSVLPHFLIRIPTNYRSNYTKIILVVTSERRKERDIVGENPPHPAVARTCFLVND